MFVFMFVFAFVSARSCQLSLVSDQRNWSLDGAGSARNQTKLRRTPRKIATGCGIKETKLVLDLTDKKLCKTQYLTFQMRRSRQGDDS